MLPGTYRRPETKNVAAITMTNTTTTRTPNGLLTNRRYTAIQAEATGAACGPAPGSAVRRVEPDRERAVVRALDGHHGPETAGRDLCA